MTDQELQTHYAQLIGTKADTATVADLEHGIEFYLNYKDDHGYPVRGDHIARAYN